MTRSRPGSISPPARTAAFSISSWRAKASASRKRSSAWRRWPACRCRRSRARTRCATRGARRCTMSWSWRRNFSRTRWRRAPARKRAAISPTAASIRRRSSSSALGYAPGERFALKEHLGSHGIPVEDMVEAGLLISGDDIPVPFDRFRDRVMFPITDLRGRVIAFGGRALEKDAQAKYLNSPETPLFHKGATLYNIAAARQAAHDGAPIIVVEGYVDVIAMVTAGFPATVAPLGTALTEDQLGAALENGGRAGALFRRRQCGPARRLSRRRSGDAAVEARQEPEVRSASARAGPGRSGALGRARGRAAMSSARRGRSPTCCGRARPKGIPSTRRSGGRRWKRASTKSLRAVGDEAVRRYYRQDFSARLSQFLCARAAAANAWAPSGTGASRAAAETGASANGDWQRQARRALRRAGRCPMWW